MTDQTPHLRAIPNPDAPDAAAQVPVDSGIPGLTNPATRGGSGRLVTDLLVELGYVDTDRVRQAMNEARMAGRAPETILLEQAAITADQLARATAERFGVAHVDLSVFHTDVAATNLLPASAAKRYTAIPVGFTPDQMLVLAMADPANILAVDDIQMMTGHEVKVAVSTREDIVTLINKMSSLEHAVSEAIEEEAGEGKEAESGLADVTDLRESADDAPVIKLVHSVLGQAIGEGASDIHFEPGENEMRVRFRVDGVLHEATVVPKRMVSGAISRIKIMANMDIAEKRIPQDGRVSLTIDDKPIDLRVVTLPKSNGEGAVLRILDKSNVLLTLDKLGMTGLPRERFETSFRKPYGAVFVTGPTGSGKSTSLYAALNDLNNVEKNIITIEDPVEYQLPGINQMQVNVKAGLTFASGLRSMLRADPDIIMVGEIRDKETAQIAVESALTGHLVLSTLHTNDAPTATTRLTEMGIEPFLTASALDCVLAQRLARRLCKHCKKETVYTAEALRESAFEVDADVPGFEAGGCPRCSGTGYKGRVGLYEVMLVSDEISSMIVERSSAEEIMHVAREQGMKTLREDGLEKVKEGLTSIDELSRVTS